MIISFILMTLTFYSRMVFKGEIKYSGIEGGGGERKRKGGALGFAVLDFFLVVFC